MDWVDSDAEDGDMDSEARERSEAEPRERSAARGICATTADGAPEDKGWLEAKGEFPRIHEVVSRRA